MNKVLFFIIFQFLFGIIPNQFKIHKENSTNRNNSEEINLPSNGIIDMGITKIDLMFLGTSGGLGFVENIESESHIFSVVENGHLPRGGNPALFVKDSIIVVSGVIDTLAQDEYLSKGTGISLSQDYGESWVYFEQPIDLIPNSGIYHYIEWFGQTIQQLAVTVEINNISYDLTVMGDFIYAASWAGGIRRIQFRNLPPIIEGEEQTWEIIPLPEDNSFELNCGYPLPDDYSIDPNDPLNGGNHNHKGFSVEAQNDSIIWVGTANGINKGIIDNNNCISWTHYTTDSNNISGNWTIGFDVQFIEDNETPIIWAITWSTNSTEINGISFTKDLGDTWQTSEMVENLELKVYNIYSKNENIYLATNMGLYFSNTGEYWEKLSRPFELGINGNIVEEILSNSVYSVAESNNYLWVGTGNGIGKTDNLGLEWNIYRSFESPETFYAYPNPFFLEFSNQVNNYGYVRFICSSNIKPDKIKIYDFSMNLVNELNHVREINGEFEVIWNGRNSLNQIVSNGVYFCNLISNNENFWTKVMVINL